VSPIRRRGDVEEVLFRVVWIHEFLIRWHLIQSVLLRDLPRERINSLWSGEESRVTKSSERNRDTETRRIEGADLVRSVSMRSLTSIKSNRVNDDHWRRFDALSSEGAVDEDRGEEGG
jgi:hypothetical protein